jgi:hypothetical protein
MSPEPDPAAGGGGGAPGGAAPGGGTPGGAAPGGAPDVDEYGHARGQPIPYARFREVVSQRTEFEGKVRQLAGERDTATTQLATLRKELDDVRARAAEDLQLVRAGFGDDEGALVARTLFGAQPEDVRKSGIGAWIDGLRQDPTKAPVALRGYLAGSAAGRRLPADPTAHPAGPPSGDPVSVDAIRAAREKGARTGDWQEFEALQKRLKQERGGHRP